MTYDDCSTPLCQPAYAHANKRLVYGVGINDYPTPISLGGKRIRSYSVWKDMLARGYSSSRQIDLRIDRLNFQRSLLC